MSCCSIRATATWRPATCSFAWTWPSSWPSWRCWSGRIGLGRPGPGEGRPRRAGGRGAPASAGGAVPLHPGGLRRRKDVLPALRKRLQAAAPGREGSSGPAGAHPAANAPDAGGQRVRRLRPDRGAGQDQIRPACSGTPTGAGPWSRWPLSASTYVGAALSLSGFVLEKLSFVRTFLVQVAGSFVTLVTPAAVGGVALNLRYLRKSERGPRRRGSQRRRLAGHRVRPARDPAGYLRAHHRRVPATTRCARRTGSTSPWPCWPAVALVVLAFPAGRKLMLSRVAPRSAR